MQLAEASTGVDTFAAKVNKAQATVAAKLGFLWAAFL